MWQKDLDGSRPIFLKHASVAQLVEQGTENPRVVGSIPIGGTTKCGFSSFGRARPCQGRGGGFEPRNPLHKAPWPSGKAQVCNTSIPSSILGGASNNEASERMLFSLLGGATPIHRNEREAPVSSGLAKRKQSGRLFSQAVSPQVRVLKQIYICAQNDTRRRLGSRSGLGKAGGRGFYRREILRFARG